jgi:hypothetical protein
VDFEARSRQRHEVTDLTPEELDDARAQEANRIYNTGHSVFPRAERTATIAARLAREGWTPPPKVDPDMLAAREWCANEWPKDREAHRAGAYDNISATRAFLAGIKHGRGS